MKSFLRGLLRRRGYEVTKGRSIGDFLRSRDVDLVLDVGANVGQYGLGLREFGYHGSIHSFEPVSAVFSQLSEAAAKDPNWAIHHCAIGSEPGETQINISRSTVYSSIRKQAKLAQRFDPANSEVVSVETVQVKDLDSIGAGTGAKNVFLKIDTQG